MRQEIARIKLNPGQGGYFDPITRIHLTHGDPVRAVYAGMNTTGLKAAVRSKRISIISGSLGDFSPPFKLVKGKDGKVKFEWVKKGEKKTPTKKATAKKSEQPKVETEGSDTSVGYSFPWLKPDSVAEAPVIPVVTDVQPETPAVTEVVEQPVESVPAWDNPQLEPGEVYIEDASLKTDSDQIDTVTVEPEPEVEAIAEEPEAEVDIEEKPAADSNNNFKKKKKGKKG